MLQLITGGANVGQDRVHVDWAALDLEQAVEPGVGLAGDQGLAYGALREGGHVEAGGPCIFGEIVGEVDVDTAHAHSIHTSAPEFLRRPIIRAMTRGEDAERLVEERLRAALPEPEYRIYVNVNWTGPVRDDGPARDGEADAVITHPEHGLLVLEVKSGEPSIDHDGHWHLGPIELKQSPFEQARTSKHYLRAKLVDLPDWPSDVDPLAGHAVAFPDVDLESLPRGHSLLGVGAPTDLVLDAHALETTDGIQGWLDHVFDYWQGDGGGRYRPLGDRGVALVDELLRPTVSLHRLVRGRIEDDRAALVDASKTQSRILNQWKSLRQVEVVGPAGSGKSMIAAERARRLAAEGYRTLLVCFNQRLATHDAARPGRCARTRGAGGDDVPSAVRAARFRGRDAAGAAGSHPPGVVGPDAARCARCGHLQR